MKQISAGVLCYKIENEQLYVLLGNAGGPYFENKECWSIPKGLVEDAEEYESTARREFSEETGNDLVVPLEFLAEVDQSSKKTVVCFIAMQDIDISKFSSNYFDLEWPPQSGIIKSFPEIKEIKWMTIEDAKLKILKGQVPLIEKLETYLQAKEK